MALKEICLKNEEQARDAIISELRMLQECDHPNIIKSYGAFLTENGVTIALEYMNAGSLASILQKVGRIPEQILAMITLLLLRGLEYLHKTQKIIHRDIKPSNILLTTAGAVKIADFGVSGSIRNSFDCMSNYAGTVLFMSPERILGKNYFSDVDLWSLGLLLLESATGRYPYPDKEDIQQELGFWDLKKYITEKSSPTLPKDDSSFSKDFHDFLAICLRKSAGTRSSAS